MDETISAFLDVKLSKLSKEAKQLAEIIIAAVKLIIENTAAGHSKELSTLTATVSDLQSSVDNKDKELKKMRDRLNVLEDQVDSNSAYERRDCLIVSGGVPEVTEGENCSKIITQLIREKLRIQMKPDDITSAHRIGRKPINQASDRRSIIIKLCRRDMKKDILAACRQLRPPFYVNESLTPTRSQVMFVLRKARGDHSDKFRTPRSYDGNVNAYVPMPGAKPQDQLTRARRVVVNSRRALDELLLEHIGCTSEKYVKDWPTRAQ